MCVREPDHHCEMTVPSEETFQSCDDEVQKILSFPHHSLSSSHGLRTFDLSSLEDVAIFTCAEGSQCSSKKTNSCEVGTASTTSLQKKVTELLSEPRRECPVSFQENRARREPSGQSPLHRRYGVRPDHTSTETFKQSLQDNASSECVSIC